MTTTPWLVETIFDDKGKPAGHRVMRLHSTNDPANPRQEIATEFRRDHYAPRASLTDTRENAWVYLRALEDRR